MKDEEWAFVTARDAFALSKNLRCFFSFLFFSFLFFSFLFPLSFFSNWDFCICSYFVSHSFWFWFCFCFNQFSGRGEWKAECAARRRRVWWSSSPSLSAPSAWTSAKKNCSSLGEHLIWGGEKGRKKKRETKSITLNVVLKLFQKRRTNTFIATKLNLRIEITWFITIMSVVFIIYYHFESTLEYK